MPDLSRRTRVMVASVGAAEMLKAVYRGDVVPTEISGGYGEVYWIVEADGWKLIIFNDAGSIDYTERLESPSGLVVEFDELVAFGVDPVDMLDADCARFLEGLFVAAE